LIELIQKKREEVLSREAEKRDYDPFLEGGKKVKELHARRAREGQGRGETAVRGAKLEAFPYFAGGKRPQPIDVRDQNVSKEEKKRFAVGWKRTKCTL